MKLNNYLFKVISKKNIYYAYKNTGGFTRLYIWIKLRICPLFEIAKYVPENADILDMGCGIGLLSNIITRSKRPRKITGIDISADKIAVATKTLDHMQSIHFIQDNITNLKNYSFNTAIISDVLYLLPDELKNSILSDCYSVLPENGILIIKEVNTSPIWKYYINLLQETLAVKIFKHTESVNRKFYFQSSDIYTKLLSNIGFTVEAVTLDKSYLYPHILYYCKKEQQNR